MTPCLPGSQPLALVLKMMHLFVVSAPTQRDLIKALGSRHHTAFGQLQAEASAVGDDNESFRCIPEDPSASRADSVSSLLQLRSRTQERLLTEWWPVVAVDMLICH